MVGYFELLPMPYESKRWWFAKVVSNTLPDSLTVLRWYDDIPKVLIGDNDEKIRNHLIKPLLDCEWHLFYEVVKNVCAVWANRNSRLECNFTPEFNKILRAHQIPWMLQSGLVVPADEYEFTDELEYLERVSAEGDVSDPRVSLKKAFAALFRKQGGPDITSACLHSWSAWETARESAGGVEHVRISYPELWESVTAWQKLIHAGRHPGKKLGRLPTEMDARFIVRLLTNAVRLVSESAATQDAS